MLSLMRKHAGSWLIKVALGAIVIVFVFWGVGSYRAQRGNRVAVVNGAVISLDEYRDSYDQLLEQYRNQFGDALNQELLNTLNLKEQALNQLINRRLILQETSRLKLHATNEELARAIQKMGAFQNNGRFDPRLYQRVLALNRLTPELFEESLKQDLLLQKMQGIVRGGIKVSDDEALETFRWREQKVDLDYVAFEPSSHKDVKVAPEEMESYFAEHRQAYELPPKVKVTYLYFGFKESEPRVSVF
jgi:peptidyl-prolyl cis-trans isomerase D